MARLGRIFLANQPLHVIQRGNDRRPIFLGPDDYARYRDWLHLASMTNGCAIHAYVLMPNHVHLLVTPRDEFSLPKTMQSLGRRYVRHVNWSYGRSGTMWEGRYRAAIIDAETCFLDCSRYIEMNPVRSNLAKHPGDYPWSSYGANARGEHDVLIKPHAKFLALGKTPAERHAAYQALSEAKLDEDFITALRTATNGGWAFGREEFKLEVAVALGRRVDPLPKGRPPKRLLGHYAA